MIWYEPEQIDKPAGCLFLYCLFPTSSVLPKQIMVEDIWQNGTFNTKGGSGVQFQKDGVHFTKLQDKAILQYDLTSGEQILEWFLTPKPQ